MRKPNVTITGDDYARCRLGLTTTCGKEFVHARIDGLVSGESRPEFGCIFPFDPADCTEKSYPPGFDEVFRRSAHTSC